WPSLTSSPLSTFQCFFMSVSSSASSLARSAYGIWASLLMSMDRSPCQLVKSVPLKRTVKPSGAFGGSAAPTEDEKTTAHPSRNAEVSKMRVGKVSLLSLCARNSSHRNNQWRLMRGKWKLRIFDLYVSPTRQASETIWLALRAPNYKRSPGFGSSLAGAL